MEKDILFKYPKLTPCINICKIDNKSGFCVGCYRTMDEISYWCVYSDQEKIEVLEHLVNRIPKESKS